MLLRTSFFLMLISFSANNIFAVRFVNLFDFPVQIVSDSLRESFILKDSEEISLSIPNNDKITISIEDRAIFDLVCHSEKYVMLEDDAMMYLCDAENVVVSKIQKSDEYAGAGDSGSKNIFDVILRRLACANEAKFNNEADEGQEHFAVPTMPIDKFVAPVSVMQDSPSEVVPDSVKEKDVLRPESVISKPDDESDVDDEDSFCVVSDLSVKSEDEDWDLAKISLE